MNRSILSLFMLTALVSKANAQVPVELFVGQEKATIDLQFFRFFKDREGKQSRWLFFNRNRASVDYRMTSSVYRPQFGFTEAISYNPPALKGFAPVAVAQVFSAGVYPKLGVQYSRSHRDWVIFSWLVTETLASPDLDYFLLLRYTPALNDRWRVFLQAETLNTIPLHAEGSAVFIQRLRAGLKRMSWQWGLGTDLVQNKAADPSFDANMGIFLRYEF